MHCDFNCVHLPADSPFSLTNKATGLCLVRRSNRCLDVRWTTGNRLFVTSTKKCLGAQGKSTGSEVNLYDCDDRSALQKWECRNETLIALKDTNFYIEVKADESVALSRTITENNQLTITGSPSGACTRTFRGTVKKKKNSGEQYTSNLTLLLYCKCRLLIDYSLVSKIDRKFVVSIYPTNKQCMSCELCTMSCAWWSKFNTKNRLKL